ncbi:hypothetical protein PAAG_09069, partial [Paracoccidioides lutzii Pb01]
TKSGRSDGSEITPTFDHNTCRLLWITLKGHHVHQSCGEDISLKETLQNPTFELNDKNQKDDFPGLRTSWRTIEIIHLSGLSILRIRLRYQWHAPHCLRIGLAMDYQKHLFPNYRLSPLLSFLIQAQLYTRFKKLSSPKRASLEPDLLKGSSPITDSHLGKLPVTPRPMAGNITFHPQEGCVDGRDVSDQDTNVRILPPEKHKHGVRQKTTGYSEYKSGGSFQAHEATSATSQYSFDFVTGDSGEKARNPDESGNNSEGEDDEGNKNQNASGSRAQFPGEPNGNSHVSVISVIHKSTMEIVIEGTSRHLSQTHGEYVCSECYRTFENSQLRRDLAQSRTMKLHCSQEEIWASMWRERFRGAPLPKSPYWEPSSRPLLPRLNTSVEGFPASLRGNSGSSNTYNSSPSNSGFMNISQVFKYAALRNRQFPTQPQLEHTDKGNDVIIERRNSAIEAP